MWEDHLRSELRSLVDVYCAATGKTPAYVGSAAVNDGHFLNKVIYADEPKGFTIRTFDRVLVWLSSNWPQQTVWPKHVRRPPPAIAG